MLSGEGLDFHRGSIMLLIEIGHVKTTNLLVVAVPRLRNLHGKVLHFVAERAGWTRTEILHLRLPNVLAGKCAIVTITPGRLGHLASFSTTVG